ncbi:hypothetical protein K474DRAFT_587040 [Panus rudis PR-1116 ss-1]|nr:hypothetical protein K474DRAFT_587040 [Panus rudis PR-1116 ss-1]
MKVFIYLQYHRPLQILLYAITIGEVLFDLISWAPSLRDHVPHFAQSLCAHSAAQNIRVTPAFLVGCSLSIAGGILRLICYRALGRQFTFELSLRKDDKLITSGPYAYVRHPSYTGAFACIIGYVVWLLSSGSWFAECGMWQTTGGRAYALTSIVVVVFFLTTVLKRIEKEDRVLRDTYGAQWDAWAKKTPYRVLPGIY